MVFIIFFVIWEPCLWVVSCSFSLPELVFDLFNRQITNSRHLGRSKSKKNLCQVKNQSGSGFLFNIVILILVPLFVQGDIAGFSHISNSSVDLYNTKPLPKELVPKIARNREVLVSFPSMMVGSSFSLLSGVPASAWFDQPRGVAVVEYFDFFEVLPRKSCLCSHQTPCVCESIQTFVACLKLTCLIQSPTQLPMCSSMMFMLIVLVLTSSGELFEVGKWLSWHLTWTVMSIFSFCPKLLHCCEDFFP